MNELAILAKYWQPGFVKTRLARDVGPRDASALHRQFLAALLRRLGSLGTRRRLVYAPRDRRESFAELVGGLSWLLTPQGEGDLGQRMARYFEVALCSGADAAVLLGADSPALPIQYLQDAFEQLKSHDVVLGPARDGGYYLIGLRSPRPDLFHGIAWGSDRVWQQTVDRLQRFGGRVRYAMLPCWYDVDDLADLQRLTRDLAAASDSDASLAELLSFCQQIVNRLAGAPRS